MNSVARTENQIPAKVRKESSAPKLASYIIENT
jgi:hypothetical protein